MAGALVYFADEFCAGSILCSCSTCSIVYYFVFSFFVCPSTWRMSDFVMRVFNSENHLYTMCIDEKPSVR